MLEHARPIRRAFRLPILQKKSTQVRVETVAFHELIRIMAESAAASASGAGGAGGGAGSSEQKRFEIKKWNAVALWSWGALGASTVFILNFAV